MMLSAPEQKKSKVLTLTVKLPHTKIMSGTTGLLTPDVLVSICQWFSPRQLRQLVQTCKAANRVLLTENEGYWGCVAAHILFRQEYIVELERHHGERPFPGFELRMPELVPNHNLYHMLGLDITRGQAYQLFIERLNAAIRANSEEFPGWMEYVGLSTRDMVLKKFDEVVDDDMLQNMQDLGAVGDVRRFGVSMREIALVVIDQTCFYPPRIRAMHAFTHDLEDDQAISPEIKRRIMRKLHALQSKIDVTPGRVFSARETIRKICRF